MLRLLRTSSWREYRIVAHRPACAALAADDLRRTEQCPHGCLSKQQETVDVKLKKVRGEFREGHDDYEFEVTFSVTIRYYCPPVVPVSPPPSVPEEPITPTPTPVPTPTPTPTPICNAACNCIGPRCTAGPPPGHYHWPNKAREGSGALEESDNGCFVHGGRCTLPADHEGKHWCLHGHHF